MSADLCQVSLECGVEAPLAGEVFLLHVKWLYGELNSKDRAKLPPAFLVVGDDALYGLPLDLLVLALFF